MVDNVNNLERDIGIAMSDIREKAKARKNAAYTTGMCVVGNDMESALFLVEEVLLAYDFANEYSYEQQKLELELLLRDAAETYSGPDAEGYVAGTIITVANSINSLSCRVE